MEKKLTRHEILAKYGVDFSGVCFSYGNAKLPKNHLIINFTSGKNCPSKERGLCRVKNCYAIKCERLRPTYLAKNINMEEFFSKCSIEDAIALIETYVVSAPNKITHIRFNEAGDFVDDRMINMADKIAEYFKKKWHIQSYGWSARTDLDILFKDRSFILNASNPEQTECDKHFYCVPKNVFDSIVLKKGEWKCKSDCSICHVCSTKCKIHTVYCKQH